MKKILPIIIALVLIEGLSTHVNAQRHKKAAQLYLMSTEIVKPEMKKEYLKARISVNQILIESEFPYPFILWNSIDNHYHIWYPVNELNDIKAIENAWEAFSKKHEDVSTTLLECIETSISKVILVDLDLTYEPDQPLYSETETNFSRLTKLYLKQGTEKEVHKLAKQRTELYESNGVNRAYYYGEGMLGFELPVILSWSFGKNPREYNRQESATNEMLGDVYKLINEEISQYVRKWETLDFHYVPGLSYGIN
jgi:hypothetical protein